MVDEAQAFWLRESGRGEIRPVALPEPGRGDVVVRTLRSGVSRGAKTLVFRGGVPPRGPFREGDFPGPVKYGYLSVGAVEEGPPELRGRTVFCLYPHQTAYVVPAGAVTVVPDDVPPARAVPIDTPCTHEHHAGGVLFCFKQLCGDTGDRLIVRFLAHLGRKKKRRDWLVSPSSSARRSG